MKQKIEQVLSKMSLEQKASLCSGLNRWLTKPVEEQEVSSIRMNDGSVGLRYTPGDHPLEKSKPAVSFPCLAAVASTWDRELIEEMGKAVAREACSHGVHIVLGPGVNMKRSPLCGRNFEYFSEDPYLSGELGVAYVNGVQSQGVGTSLKHLAANNQETRRMSIDARVSERALREIYLPAFERVVKDANPWTVMCSYNSVNGEFTSQNHRLLTKILREEWGFEGVVVSDWEAVFDRVRGLAAGLDLEMPGNGGINDTKIVQAVREGELKEEVLDVAVERLLRLIFKARDNEKYWDQGFDGKEQHILAGRIAENCIVLLKNHGDVLPLDPMSLGSIAIIGRFARSPRFQGGGSAHLNPTQIDAAFDEIETLAGENTVLRFAPGYDEGDEIDETLIDDAVELCRDVDAAVIFAGLPDIYESERYDRGHMDLPPGQNRLIEKIAMVQQNTVVVLSNGSSVTMPWKDQVKGIVEGWLLGQAGGGAIARMLFGKVNPSGKLSETFPRKLQDNPSYLNFPGDTLSVLYGEGIYIGYRYYDKKQMEVLYPFGYGLSYTTFEYTALELSSERMASFDTLTVTVRVRNTGKRAGREIIQLYVKDRESSIDRPEKELKGFNKVTLEPGEEKAVTFKLGRRDFAFYDEARKDWSVETGEFEISVGGSSQDLPLRATVYVESQVLPLIHESSTVRDWFDHPKARDIAKEFLTKSKAIKNWGIDMADPRIFERICYRPMIKFAYMEGLSEAEFQRMIRRAN